MNNVTFKILERQNGEFVLFLHNHGQKLVCEEFRSRNLEAVVDCGRNGDGVEIARFCFRNNSAVAKATDRYLK